MSTIKIKHAPMVKKYKTLWLKALRSGKYKGIIYMSPLTVPRESSTLAAVDSNHLEAPMTNDNDLVFTLPEALSEIGKLRQQKTEAVEALKFVAGHIGGSVGERAALALGRIDGTIRWQR